MQNRVVLVSNDNNFFEFMLPRLSLRKNDDVFRFSYNVFLEKISLLSASIIILDSENYKDNILYILKNHSDLPIIVFGYNEDLEFKKEILKFGVPYYITPLTTKNEFQYIFKNLLKIAALQERNRFFKSILIEN